MDIVIKDLTKSYGPQRAVDNISFTVNTGEILGFLGPNGAGKTTTMKMITNFIQMDHGDIEIGGQSVSTGELKKSIGYLPENNPLYEDMGIIEYLEFCARLQGVANDQISTQIIKMIRVCGLNAEKHKKIGELSKGYRQRVGLAQALIHDPEILILDEPTTGLDPNQIVEIRELIRNIGKEKTVILSTHILPEVEATCDRILIINKGKIVADGTAESLRKEAQHQQIVTLSVEGAQVGEIAEILRAQSYISTAEILNIDQPRFEITSNHKDRINADIFRLCVSNKWILTELSSKETKLEDIFRDLTLN